MAIEFDGWYLIVFLFSEASLVHMLFSDLSLGHGFVLANAAPV